MRCCSSKCSCQCNMLPKIHAFLLKAGQFKPVINFFYIGNAWCSWQSHNHNTGCFRRSLAHFRRTFFLLDYFHITEHTCIQSRMVMEIMARKLWCSCCSPCRTCFTCFIHTLCRAVLEPIAKPSHMEARVLYEVVGTLRMTYETSASFSCAVNPVHAPIPLFEDPF
jgi:hypothetical protein